MPKRTRPRRSNLPLIRMSGAPARHARRRRSGEAAAGALRAAANEPLGQPTGMAGPAEEPRGHRYAAQAALISILLGMTTAMAMAGLSRRFEGVFGRNFACGETVVAAALAALALGVSVPQRLAMKIALLAWRRFLSRGEPAHISWAFTDRSPSDPSWSWMVLAAIVLFAGVATALLPLSVRLALGVYEQMQTHFVWSLGPLVILEAGTVLVAALVSFGSLGVALSLTHRLTGRWGTWEVRSSGWILLGAAPGVAITGLLARAGNHRDLLLVAAALPALVGSLLSAGWSSWGRGAPGGEERSPEPVLPLSSDRWPTLLRASIVAVGGATIWAVSTWNGSLEVHLGRNELALPAMLLAVGVGVWIGGRGKPSGTRSISGFGVACVMVGVITVAGTLMRPSRASPASVLPVALAWASLAGLGFAGAYGRQALLSRVASRPRADAAVLGRTLLCGAVVVWVVAPVAGHLWGERPSLSFLGLLMLALGGTLVIHEPVCSARTRRVRLGAVFAVMALMIFLALFRLGP